MGNSSNIDSLDEYTWRAYDMSERGLVIQAALVGKMPKVSALPVPAGQYRRHGSAHVRNYL